MRAALALGAFAGILAAQQPGTPTAIPAPERVMLANGAANLVAPVLRLLEMTPAPDDSCNGKSLTGTVGLSLVVDAQGRPRNVMLKDPLANDLDYLAVHFMEANRFQPAMLNGSPAAVAGTANVHVRGCIGRSKNGAGQTSYSLHLRTLPKVDFEVESHMQPDAALTPYSVHLDPVPADPVPGVSAVEFTAPKPINHPRPDFGTSMETGKCKFSVVVDEHGLPQNVHGIQCSNSEIARPAMEAVRTFRFLPGMKDGMPIPVQVTIELGKQIL
jgi:hypothetical protein